MARHHPADPTFYPVGPGPTLPKGSLERSRGPPAGNLYPASMRVFHTDHCARRPVEPHIGPFMSAYIAGHFPTIDRIVGSAMTP